MGKYDVPNDEFEPGSNGLVLKNYLGITTPEEMDMLESAQLHIAQKHFYDRLDLDHSFNVTDILGMHKSWLGSIYPFAGQLRKVDVGKDGFQFASVQFLESNLQLFEKDFLKRLTPCKGQTIDAIAENMAMVHGELIMLHPFREGNGRTGRWLADAMAYQAGFHLPDYGIGRREQDELRSEYLRAVKKAVLLDTNDLTQFFSKVLFRGAQPPS